MLQTHIVCGLCMLTLVFSFFFYYYYDLTTTTAGWAESLAYERKTLIHKRRARRAAGKESWMKIYRSSLRWASGAIRYELAFCVCLLLHSDGLRKIFLLSLFAPFFHWLRERFGSHVTRKCFSAYLRCLAGDLAFQQPGTRHTSTFWYNTQWPQLTRNNNFYKRKLVFNRYFLYFFLSRLRLHRFFVWITLRWCWCLCESRVKSYQRIFLLFFHRDSRNFRIKRD